jgi:hypothetical protein
LVYDQTGHVFLHVARDSVSVEVRRKWQLADSAFLLQLLRGTEAYVGTFRINYASSIVAHQIEVETPPNLGVTEVATPFRLSGDTLRLGRDSFPNWTFLRVH